MGSSGRICRQSEHGNWVRTLLLRSALVLCFTPLCLSGPVSLPFSICAPSTVTESNPLKRVNVTAVYGQIYHADDPTSRQLKISAFGEIGDTLDGYSNTTGYLATLFTTTNYLTYSIFDNTSALCDTLRPPSPLPPLAANDTTSYCPLAAGPLAFGLSIPLDAGYPLKTLVTQIRIVDSSSPAHELTCLQIAATPTYEGKGIYGPWYGIFWATIGLTVAYWAVTGLGRISAAWDRGLGRSGNKLWMRTQRTGFVIASALSGEKFSVSPALLRYVTPSARDLILTTQWCAMLGMIAVEWPDFAYPIFSSAAWSTLLSNTTLVSGHDTPGTWSPLYSGVYDPPSAFADQLSDGNSPIFLDSSAPNSLLVFPPNAKNGMAKFVSSAGVLPQHAFGICLSIFLLIVATVIVISAIITIIGWTGSSIFGKIKKVPSERKDAVEVDGRRTPWKRRFSLNSFHGSVTHGNLVRLLILFHLPITIYSCYHLTLNSSVAPVRGKVLAGLSFTIFSLLLPAWLIFRIATTSTSKLYEATRTLLALGPLYNQYQPKSQLFCGLFFASNVVTGVVVGFGQNSGTVQAVIILVVEVLVTLSTSVWLPWMTGAQMGVISFMFCVARIIATVLVVILAPPVSIGPQAGGWIALGIVSVLGLMYVGFSLMLVVKLLEGIIRLIRGVSFASSRHTLDSGLFGAMGCCGGTAGRRKKRRNRDARHSRAYSETSAAATHPNFSVAREANVSYLKPEQASMPYRESSDDDTGFIMESWSKTDLNLPGGAAPSKSKLAFDDLTITDESSPSTGFARVGGGRAHFDNPYSISKGKQSQSIPRTSISPPPVTQFATNVPPSTYRPSSRSPEPLPKGAARPIHSRTRSQTAVIEDASTLLGAGAIAVPTLGSNSRPGSAGNTSASRPGSSGRSASQSHHGHGPRPGSSGKQSKTFTSRPPSGNIPTTKDMPSRQDLLRPDEMGVGGGLAPPKSASTSKGKGRGWFGLGNSSHPDSSSDEEDDERSKASSVKRSGRWGFKRRRNSESDMLPLPTPPAENRSFVVIRNRPPNLGALPAAEPLTVDESGQWGGNGMDHLGSPLPESTHLPAAGSMTLVNRTAFSPPAENEPLRTLSPPPPSSYVPPRRTNSRRMSSPSA